VAALNTLTVAQLVANLNALYSALGNPAASAHMPDGSSVTFRSIDDIKKAIAETEDAIRQAGSTGAGTKSTLAQHKRGDGPRGPGLQHSDLW